MFKYDVLCVGSATVDNFLTTGQSLQKIKLGDKVLVNISERHSGGGATNSAAALSKFGLRVKMLTKLGDDFDANFIIKDMKNYRIKNICKNKSRKKTDSATIISSKKEKDRVIYVQKGASRGLSINDYKRSQLNVKWVYLASLMGKSFSVANDIANYCKRKKINLLFNPSLYLASKGKNYLKKVLLVTEILVLNKKEAQALLKKEGSIKKMLMALSKLGPKTVVITNGSKRLYALHENKFYSLIPPNVRVIHTAGAGDAFTAGFLAGIIKGYSFDKALCLGQANSSSVIQNVGTKNKLLNEKESLKVIKRYRLRCKVVN